MASGPAGLDCALFSMGEALLHCPPDQFSTRPWTRGSVCVLPNSLLSEPWSPARTSPVTCFNLDSALEVMLRMKQALCSFWCRGWTQSSVEPWSKCGHIHVPWPDKDSWKREISQRRPAHVPESQHHKQQHGSFFKALTFGVGYYSIRDYQNTCIWEKGKRWGNKWY